MSGRRRARRPGPAKGSPLTLPELFWWTVIVTGFAMVTVLVVAYSAQANDPNQVEQVCVADWDCNQHRVNVDTNPTSGATR